ncbi:uncharacterized protein CLUP02_06050 [Colletotrichum lupini]|uniref:DUF202 domain-containing protein n=1 Tax=Colletotrichum lupini TaxID=145971 RepID=A0A9Q8SQ65_9PEZI|nr:uncharacterized protein CLUP02_06050 [Colletotrichum lupini]UQC80567.1 hypothetical protein CLUP02_06050 [Colletotrichum lupini]
MESERKTQGETWAVCLVSLTLPSLIQVQLSRPVRPRRSGSIVSVNRKRVGGTLAVACRPLAQPTEAGMRHNAALLSPRFFTDTTMSYGYGDGGLRTDYLLAGYGQQQGRDGMRNCCSSVRIVGSDLVLKCSAEIWRNHAFLIPRLGLYGRESRYCQIRYLTFEQVFSECLALVMLLLHAPCFLPAHIHVDCDFLMAHAATLPRSVMWGIWETPRIGRNVHVSEWLIAQYCGRNGGRERTRSEPDGKGPETTTHTHGKSNPSPQGSFTSPLQLCNWNSRPTVLDLRLRVTSDLTHSSRHPLPVLHLRRRMSMDPTPTSIPPHVTLCSYAQRPSLHLTCHLDLDTTFGHRPSINLGSACVHREGRFPLPALASYGPSHILSPMLSAQHLIPTTYQTLEKRSSDLPACRRLMSSGGMCFSLKSCGNASAPKQSAANIDNCFRLRVAHPYGSRNAFSSVAISLSHSRWGLAPLCTAAAAAMELGYFSRVGDPGRSRSAVFLSLTASLAVHSVGRRSKPAASGLRSAINIPDPSVHIGDASRVALKYRRFNARFEVPIFRLIREWWASMFYRGIDAANASVRHDAELDPDFCQVSQALRASRDLDISAIHKRARNQTIFATNPGTTKSQGGDHLPRNSKALHFSSRSIYLTPYLYGDGAISALNFAILKEPYRYYAAAKAAQSQSNIAHRDCNLVDILTRTARGPASWYKSLSNTYHYNVSVTDFFRNELPQLTIASSHPYSQTPKTTFTCASTAPVPLVEIRAAQRTFEGAYMRTALSQFSFALIILKIFTSEFYAIGALFAVYGAAVMLVAIFRRHEGNRQFFTSPKVDEGSGVASGGVVRKFRTSGNSVAMLTVLSLAAYVTLLVLTWQLVQ